MTIVFFTHPGFMESQSMPRFAAMLTEGMISRGHQVEILTAKPFFYKFPVPKSLKKWVGYMDQYLLFPYQVNKIVKKHSSDKLYVFTDQALGPWIPLVSDRPHLVHCHDFLAQRSALDQIALNKTGWTGKRYQAFIRKGYTKAKNFISVSQKTQSDLHEFLKYVPPLSEVVYNGLNKSFVYNDSIKARNTLQKHIGAAIDLSNGYILHVGGNQWYKNRAGVVEIYNAWRKLYNQKLPLLLIGQEPSPQLSETYQKSAYKQDIHFLTQINDELINLSYSGASLFLFPSIAEGFGWPIAEAMASGCPVITTDIAPMTEVAGNAAYLIPCMPDNPVAIESWAETAALSVHNVLSLNEAEKQQVIDKGFLNAKRFDTEKALDKIEEIYLKVIKQKNSGKQTDFSHKN